MIGPTWADVATQQRKTESREVKILDRRFTCPFCKATGPANWLRKTSGYVCICGALFYAQQAVAVHFKERG